MRTAELSEYFLQFDTPKWKFRNLAVTPADSILLYNKNNRSYFLLNGDYNSILKDKVDSIIKNSAALPPMVPIRNQNNVVLFRVDDILVLKTLQQFSTTDL